jgi:hypothetical protein
MVPALTTFYKEEAKKTMEQTIETVTNEFTAFFEVKADI